MNIATLHTDFRRVFGTAPEVTVRAPGRINLIGEHTDYNEGWVMPAAIDRTMLLAASPRSDGRLGLYACDVGESFLSDDEVPVFQQEKRWANYLLGVVSELREAGHVVGGLNLAFGGDVPPGAGLSSSAALGSAVVLAVQALYALPLSPMHMVKLVQRSENRFVGVPCGIMDMFASIMSRAGQVLQLDCRSLEYVYVPFEAPGYQLLLLDSDIKHALVDGEYQQRRAACESGVGVLRGHFPHIHSLRDVSEEMLEAHRAEMPPVVYQRCRFVVEEMHRVEQAVVALTQGQLEVFGQYMYDCHAGLDKQYGVCVPQTNFLVEQARAWPGVLGARQVGGGFGGCVLVFLREAAAAGFVKSAQAAYVAAFDLPLKVYPVRLTDGAHVCPDQGASGSPEGVV